MQLHPVVHQVNINHHLDQGTVMIITSYLSTAFVFVVTSSILAMGLKVSHLLTLKKKTCLGLKSRLTYL